MVLINNLTIDEINAALLHLQRARTEVVGGTKGSTVQNITISNKGGGSTVDYAPTITALSNRIDKNTDDIESVEGEIDKIQATLEQLSDNGISSIAFDPVSRQLQINTQDGEVYSCDITSENITLEFDATTNKLSLYMGEQAQEVTLPYINANEKGSANGVATLDENGRVPYSQLPESAMEFLGQWNASTNTPHLEDGTGTNGDFYIVSVGGTVTFGTGNTQTFVPNDRVIYNGATSQWIKLPAGQVSSVNGMSGAVTLSATDIEYSTGVSIKAKIDANAVQADWNVSDTTSLAYIKNKPSLATVATSGSYTDLSDKPTLGTAAECNASCFRASTWNPNMNDVSNATSVIVAQNTVCRKIIMTNQISNVGFITRVGIGLQRSTSGWGEALLSVGTNDAGTTFYDYKFSNTGVLTAACFCGNLCGTVSYGGSTLSGYTATVPSPANTTRYVLVNVGSAFGGNVVAQIYTSKYFIEKSDSSSRVITDGYNYGSFAFAHLGTPDSPSTCIWLRFAGYRPMLLCGEYPITIVCNTTTAPSGVSFTNPVGVCCAAYLSTYPADGSDNISSLKAVFNTVPKSVGTAVRLQHGAHSMAFGWFLEGYAYANAYGGWFVSDYNIPKFVGINNGTWAECTIITSETIGSQHVTCADSATSANKASFLCLNCDCSDYWWDIPAFITTGTCAAAIKACCADNKMKYQLSTGTLRINCIDLRCPGGIPSLISFEEIACYPGGRLYRLGCSSIYRFKNELVCTVGYNLYDSISEALQVAFGYNIWTDCGYGVGAIGSRCFYINGGHYRCTITGVNISPDWITICGLFNCVEASRTQTSCVYSGCLDFIFLGK